MGLRISLNLPWAKFYSLTGIGLGMVVVAAGFTTGICVEFTAMAAASVLTSKDFSISLILNCLFIRVFVLFFLSAA